MDSAIRERLRLTLAIALSLLPGWVKHDFAKRGEPRHGRAKDAIVDAVLGAVDGEFDLAEKAERERYRGWGE
jgi:hypothetical protein